MTALQGNPDAPRPDFRTVVGEDPDVESRYREYRRRQSKAMVSLLPKEGIRPLYARAREWGRDTGMEVEKDPLATLLLYVEELLLLPPLEVWLQDRVENLEAHLRDEFESPQAYRRSSPPVTVESRGMDMDGRRWRATLNLFRRDEAWRGFIAFNPLGAEGKVRTADIFRENDPEEIRERFLSFHNQTLQAFLRSVLPS
jgi:hypothetical protein